MTNLLARTAFLLVGLAACSNNARQMELQEKCAAAATRTLESFKEDYPYTARQPTTVFSYTNHYSLTKQKCYVEIKLSYDVVTLVTVWTLKDAMENKEIGFFRSDLSGDTCKFGERVCTGYDEYRKLASEYLEK